MEGGRKSRRSIWHEFGAAAFPSPGGKLLSTGAEDASG